MVADEHVFDHRELAEEADILEGPCHAGLGNAMWRRAGKVASRDENAAGGWTEQPAHDVDQGRLPGAIGSDQPTDRSLFDVKGDLVQRSHASETPADFLDAEHRYGSDLGVAGRGPGRRPPKRRASARQARGSASPRGR